MQPPDTLFAPTPPTVRFPDGRVCSLEESGLLTYGRDGSMRIASYEFEVGGPLLLALCGSVLGIAFFVLAALLISHVLAMSVALVTVVIGLGVGSLGCFLCSACAARRALQAQSCCADIW